MRSIENFLQHLADPTDTHQGPMGPVTEDAVRASKDRQPSGTDDPQPDAPQVQDDHDREAKQVKLVRSRLFGAVNLVLGLLTYVAFSAAHARLGDPVLVAGL